LEHEEASNPGKAWKGVLGNACSHLKLLEDLSARAPQNDYYLILEDDVIFDIERFAFALIAYLDLDQGHWSMLAFDTFQVVPVKGNKTFDFSAPEVDRIDGPLDLYLFSGSWGYWGAHAWLVHDARVRQLWDHLRSIPTMPLDWYPKWSSQLHTTFISYQTGSVWQRKYAPQDQVSTACAYKATSDILDAGIPRIGQAGQHSRSSKSEVVILGMYNSGTNLFSKLLQGNIEKPLNIELCKNYSGFAYCGRVWKHTHPKRLSETISLRPDYGDFNQTVAIVLVRHPFSFIHSLQNGENYDVHCGEPRELPRGKSVGIKQSCTYVPPTGHDLETQMGNERIERPICPSADKEDPQCWQNVADGWNSYISGYLYNINRLFKQVKIIRYEDLVQAPERTMRDLTQDVLPDPGPRFHWTPYEDPGKRLGGNRSDTLQKLARKPKQFYWTPFEGQSKKLGGNRSDALQKLTQHNYGANFNKDELKLLCAQLDIHLMGRLGYHGCTPALNEGKHQNIDTSITQFIESGEQDQNDQGIDTSTSQWVGSGEQDQKDPHHLNQFNFPP
jgi:hypothetical protein